MLTWKSLVLGAMRNRQVEEMRAFAAQRPQSPTIQLKSIAGRDVLHGLNQAVYSGG